MAKILQTQAVVADTFKSQEETRFAESAFGEQVVAQELAFIQAAPVYNLLPSNFRAYTATGGGAGVENKMFKANSGTSAGGYGAIQSFRSMNYKPGEGAIAKFTALFESNAANSWQGAGLVNLGDELSFGYNGTDFGVWHRYGGIAEVRTVTVTGAASGSENLTLTLNGTAETIPLTSGTVEHNAYEIADYINSSVSGWDADQLDDTVIISAASDGAKSGSYSFSSSTATGTIAQTTAGVTKTSDFVAQANWNGQSVSIDPSKGNVYKIRYQYLGFGAIFYDIEDPNTGKFKTVHTIKFANGSTTPSLGNPSMKFGIYAVNITNTSNLIVRSGSCGLFVDGQRVPTRNPRGVVNTQSVGTSFTNILTLRNRRTYNGYINQVEIQPLLLDISSETGSKNFEIEIRSTTDTGVEQDFTNVGTNLVGDIDTSSVTVTAGRLLATAVVAPQTNTVIDLKALGIRLPPSLHLVVQAKKASGAASDISASLTYYEDL